MKFLLALFGLVIAGYFALDAYLSSLPPATLPSKRPESELIKGMAQFLEQNPGMARNSLPQSLPNQSLTPSDPSAQTSNSTADAFFKDYLRNSKDSESVSFEERTRNFVRMSDFIREHPEDSLRSLESAWQSSRSDQEQERNAIRPALIHAAIFYIENQVEDDSSKKGYLRRVINHSNDPEIKEALESHFPELLDSSN
jgi:hypothetical protein